MKRSLVPAHLMSVFLLCGAAALSGGKPSAGVEAAQTYCSQRGSFVDPVNSNVSGCANKGPADPQWRSWAWEVYAEPTCSGADPGPSSLIMVSGDGVCGGPGFVQCDPWVTPLDGFDTASTHFFEASGHTRERQLNPITGEFYCTTVSDDYQSANKNKILCSQCTGSCPGYCDYQDPCNTNPEEIPVNCPISGPVDVCMYPGTGCPLGEEVSPGGCCYQFNSPVLLDVRGDGFHLTNLEFGVPFSIGPVPRLYQVSWTLPGSDDAWLALDRNGNGTIDSGAELFGNHTEQPPTIAGELKNGFRALGMFDEPELGGNRDGEIDRRDRVFRHLVLWQDWNHNGLSEPGELSGLAELGVASLSLKYRNSRYVDPFGNVFRFRAKVKWSRGGQGDRWAYDVFLLGRRR